MAAKNLKIYSLLDFQKADRLDRIRMNLVEPDRFFLTETEEIYAATLAEAYHIVFEQFSRAAAVKLIEKNIVGAETWYKANRIYDDMNELYASFISKNKKMRTAIAVEKMYALAASAEQIADIYLAAKLYDQAFKLEGLYAPDPIEREELRIPQLIISSDPQVFIESAKLDTDDFPENENAKTDE